MSQNSVQRNTLAIPSGWKLPKYQLGQTVSVRVFDGDRYSQESVLIIGMLYRSLCTHPYSISVGFGWEYQVMLDPSSTSWFVEDEILIRNEDEISPLPMDALETAN